MKPHHIAAVVLALLPIPLPSLASNSPAFDEACTNYYSQGNDSDVAADAAADFCSCLATEYTRHGLGVDALEFFARTYSDDLTTFIHEYPRGETWMDQSFKAAALCKSG